MQKFCNKSNYNNSDILTIFAKNIFMKNFNYNQWSTSILKSKKRIAIPIMTHPGIEYIGATIKEACFNGEIHSNAVCALNKKHPSSATTVIMDLTVEAEAFGAKIVSPDDEIPSVVGRVVTNTEEIRNMRVPSLDEGRIQEYIKANRLTAEKVTDKPVFSGCIGPYSLAGRLYDMTEIMMATFLEPESIKLLLEKCSDFIISYCKALKATGSNGVIIAEPAAGLMSNEDCLQFSSFYIKKMVEALQDESFPVILHNCGNRGHCTSAMVASGAAALHFGNAVSMPQAAIECPSDLIIMGNIDPVSIMKQSDPKSVYDSVLKLLTDMKGYPNFILSTGCDTPPNTPEENISAFYHALNDYNNSL